MTTTTPAGPRLKAGAAVSAAHGKLILLTGGRSREVSGGDALGLVLPVARLLDGARGWAEIARATGIDPGKVERVGAFLRALDMLDEGADADTDAVALRAYLAGHWEIDSTAGALTPFLDRAAQAAVSIAAPPELAERIGADLSAAGVGEIRALDPESDAGTGSQVAIVSRQTPGVDELVDRLRRGGASVLTFAATGTEIEIGPMFEPGSGACHRCYRLARAARPGTAGTAGSPASDLVAGLVAHEALTVATGFGEPASRGAVVCYSLPELSRIRYLLAAEPGCPACPPPADALVDVFEDTAQLRGPDRPTPASVERSRKKLIDGLADARPDYSFHPKLPLPSFDDAEPAAAHELGPDVVARMLRMTAGRRDDARRRSPARWVASGGNLGSVELFALFAKEFQGWPPGTVFRYDDIGHRLIVTGTHRAAVPNDGDLTLVFVTNVGRLATKYGEFGLRLAHLDAGCALAQLRQVAGLLGLGVRIRDPRDPDLVRDLELLSGPELVTAVATICLENTESGEG